MRFLTHVNLAALGAAGFAIGLGLLFTSEQGLPAANAQAWVPLLDSDGDGLDDALEARLGLADNLGDTDGDGFTDAEELILERNPAIADAALPDPFPAIYVNAYALGGEVFFQVFLLHKRNSQGLAASWVTTDRAVVMTTRQLRRYRAEAAQVPSPSLPSWKLQVLTFRLPGAPFMANQESAVAFRAVLDGVTVGNQVPITVVGGDLMQFVPFGAPVGYTDAGTDALATGGNSVNLSQSGGGGEAASGGGGLFPLDPGDNGQPQGTSDQVCYQVVAPVANLGGGRVLYEVISAGCESMARAICFTGCSATVGDQYVLVDVIGLLGG